MIRSLLEHGFCEMVSKAELGLRIFQNLPGISKPMTVKPEHAPLAKPEMDKGGVLA